MLRLDSTDLEILYDAADFYKSKHRYDKALRSYPLVIAHPKAEDWQVANTYGYMGELHIATGNLPATLYAYTKSFEAYEKLHRSDPKHSFYKQNLAISYAKLGETHMALGNLPQALTFLKTTTGWKKNCTPPIRKMWASKTAWPFRTISWGPLAATN